MMETLEFISYLVIFLGRMADSKMPYCGTPGQLREMEQIKPGGLPMPGLHVQQGIYPYLREYIRISLISSLIMLGYTRSWPIVIINQSIMRKRVKQLKWQYPSAAITCCRCATPMPMEIRISSITENRG